MNEVMNRPMFGGNMQDSSVGVGITSGLATPEQQMDEQVFAETANGMQNMLSDIDGAESTEGIINAMRGNQAPLEQRYQELASYVGEADAGKTPETVLTLIQPTFTMMELSKQSAPAGGIADAMPMSGGDTSPGNIDMASGVRSPGMDEAVMRMTQGEQPVFRQAGSPATGENFGFGSTTYGQIFPNIGVYAPDYQTIDRAAIQQDANELLKTMNPYFTGIEQRIGNITPEKRLATFQSYLPERKTTQDLLTEYETLLGTDDKTSNQAQAYLALAKAGQSIAGSDKGLLGAVIDAGGEAVPALSKLASEQTARDRTLKLAALQESKNIDKSITDIAGKVALSAISDRNDLQTTLDKTKVDVVKDFVGKGIDLQEGDLKVVNDKITQEFNIANKYALTPSQTFFDPETKDIVEARMSAEGYTYIDKNNNVAPLPSNYIKYKKGLFKDLGISAEDLKLVRENLLIPYSTTVTDGEGTKMTLEELLKKQNPNVELNVTGWHQVPGFRKGGSTFMSLSGSEKDLVEAPPGYQTGKLTDIIATEVDGDGNVRVLNKMNGREIVVAARDEKGQIQRFGEPLDVIYNDIPQYEDVIENGQPTGRKRLIQGNPLVQSRPNDEIGLFKTLPIKEQNKAKVDLKDIHTTIDFLNQMEEYLSDGLGPKSWFKGFSNSVIAPFAGSGDSGARFERTERSKFFLEKFTKHLQKTEALSERYGIAEQKLIAEKLAEPALTFFRDPDLALVKMVEYRRQLVNTKNKLQAQINNDPNYAYQDIVPTGYETDPLLFEKPGHYDAFLIGIRTLQEKYHDQPDILNEKLQQLHIKIGPNGAKELKVNPGVYNAGALNFGK
tara:strand:+ start:6576 stop:9098 length:2523 start_codon:yes stop_codon:yes gene_type:complete